MALRTVHRPEPFEAVLFDFHSTLVDQGDARAWLELAWGRAGRAAPARAAMGDAAYDRLVAWIDRIWEHAVELDPRAERDLSAARHREVFAAVMARHGDDPTLAHALYDVMLDTWVAYEDSIPTLHELRRRGLKLALVSNIGLDVRAVLDRAGMTPLFDAVVLSFEAGAVKPAAAIFERALQAVRTAPARALMVGDSPRDDAGAARLGIRTLLLPRTHGRVHGLDAVLRLVGP